MHSTVAVSVNAGMLTADVCMVARAGQGRAGQGRAGQIASASHVSRKAYRCCIEAVRIVIVALQRVCVVAGQAAWASWVGVHCHILLTCTERHNRSGMLQGFHLSTSPM